jgi:hypothetical protein
MFSTEERLQMHRAFWEKKPMDVPLTAYRIGSLFFSVTFPASAKLLRPGDVITPDMIDVDDLLKTYDEMYAETLQTGQSAFWTADPCIGFPWMEAILGCSVAATEVSFISKPVYGSVDDLLTLSLDRENAWYKKLMEFFDKLVKHSEGRYPAAQPLLRGTSDCIGALIGQTEMACSLIESPEVTETVFLRMADTFVELINDMYDHIKPFHGGYGGGFYYDWTPGRAVWFQEDLSALMAPKHYARFVRPAAERICCGFDYTLTHLHPSSFKLLDEILKVEKLRVVQITKDVKGPTIQEMAPEFKKVYEAGKLLMPWGELTDDEIVFLLSELPPHSLFLSLMAPTVDEAARQEKMIREYCSKNKRI